MPYSDYIIKNCSAENDACGCPKQWSKLKPAFSDMVRHCDCCNKKVYLCETEEQVKFYSSVKFCIAVAIPKAMANVVEIPPPIPLGIAGAMASNPDYEALSGSSSITPNVWRRQPLPSHLADMQHDNIPAFLRTVEQSLEVKEMPAFMRSQKQ